MPESPFANRTSQTLPSDLGSVAEEPSLEEKQISAAADQTIALASKAAQDATSQHPAATFVSTSASTPRQESAGGVTPAISMPARKGIPEQSREESKKGEKSKEKEKSKDKEAPQQKEASKRTAEAGEEKKKPTKAERRALQERQRAEKAAAKETQTVGKKPAPEAARKPSTVPQTAQSRPSAQSSLPQPPPAAKAAAKTKQGRRSSNGSTKEMFAHLPQYKKITMENVFDQFPKALELHPAILQLGLRIAAGEIAGGNARCLGMLTAFKQFIQDYHLPESKELQRDLLVHLSKSIQFLVECRPISMSMSTAIRNLKLKLSQAGPEMDPEEAKEMLVSEIDTFIQEKITYADRSVADLARSKIDNRDVVLTFAFSQAVLNTFVAAKQAGKQFRVIIVDSRPHYEGRQMLTCMAEYGIPCTYLHINAICFIMKEVTKVFMGASGALSNGTILARTGSASVAMAAHAMQRPVIVCCETLKFQDRVQLDSITYNELGDPHLLESVKDRPELDSLQNWSEEPQLELLNLMYDAMPSKFVSMLVTEVGAIPPTSIPVILREYRAEPRM